MTRRKLFYSLAFFALAFVVGAALDFWRGIARQPVAESRAEQPRNQFVEVLPDGRRMRVFRWPWSPERPPQEIVHLRIPNEYIWSGGGFGAGLRAALGPGYDPNETEPYITSIILEVLWPSMEARNGPDDPRFKEGIGGSVIRIGLLPSAGFSFAEDHRGKPIIHSFYLNRRRTIDPIWAIRKYGLTYGLKPSRFGLEVYGPVSGDFSSFKDGGIVYDLYFSAEDPKQSIMVCVADQIRDAIEDSSYRARPICDHYFYSAARRAVVHLDYRRIYLPDWSLIERKVEGLLANFDIQAIDGTRP